jgi:hypothetical protein
MHDRGGAGQYASRRDDDANGHDFSPSHETYCLHANNRPWAVNAVGVEPDRQRSP